MVRCTTNVEGVTTDVNGSTVASTKVGMSHATAAEIVGKTMPLFVTDCKRWSTAVQSLCRPKFCCHIIQNFPIMGAKTASTWD